MAQFDPNKRIYGILYAGTTALFWGFLPIFIKVSMNDVAVTTVVWFRFTLATFMLYSYFLVKDRSKFSILKKPPMLLIVAAVALLANYLGFAKGIDITSPSNAQVFIQLGAMSLAVVGIIFYKEKLSFRQFLGFVVAGIGLSLFFRDQIKNILIGEDLYIEGVLWVIMAALTWATYASLQKKLVESHPPQQLNIFIFGLPAVLLIPFVDFAAFSSFSTVTWALLIFLGINTIIAYGCLAESFKYIEANKISVIVTLNPIITFITMNILGAMKVSWINPENITIYGVLGAATVISGAIMVVIPKKKYLVKKKVITKN